MNDPSCDKNQTLALHKPEIRTVVFDMDGVIFDSERGCLNIWKELAEENGLKDMENVFRKCIGTTAVLTHEILKQNYGEDFDVEKFQKIASARFHERFDNGRLPTLPYVEEILRFLKGAGYKIGLASSTREATVRQQLTDASLIDYFDNITCGDMLKVSKPAPDIYLLACRNLNTEPCMAYAIEDSYNGIRSAHAAGMHPIMVPDLIPADDEMIRLSYAIFDNLGDVIKWLT